MSTQRLLVGFLVLSMVFNGFLYVRLGSLQRQLDTALLSPRIVTATERIPFGVPQPYPIQLPGTRETVPVVVERERIVFRDLPAQRIIVEAPPAFCKTKEECDTIYAAAEQRYTFNVSLVAGTVIPVLSGGVEVNLPVARDVPFTLRAVLAERGAVIGLNLPGTGLRIDTVRTETIVPDQPYRGPRSLPNLTIHPVAGSVGASTAFLGPLVHYQNWLNERWVYHVGVRWDAVALGAQAGGARFEMSVGFPPFR